MMDLGKVAAALDRDADPAMSAALLASLRSLASDANDAHPDFEPSVEAWAAMLLAALGDSDFTEWPSRLLTLRGADLWLACAASHGDPTAVATFERDVMPEVDRALSRFSMPRDAVEETRQVVRVHLLVAQPPREPRLRRYGGQGALRAWVRTVAARLTINGLQRTKQWNPLEDAAEPAVLATPEFAQLREQHRSLFVAAFREAFAQLEPRERNLLRMHYVDGTTATALARAYRVHTATAARWLIRARERLVEAFEVAATSRLNDEAELPGLISLVQSRLETSLRTLLASTRGIAEEHQP